MKASTALREAATNAIIAPGRNCWRAERAERFYCIQDAAAYFRLVRDAVLKARHSIFILGWDTTASVDLVPGDGADRTPSRLDKLLRHVARRRRDLQCYILIWDYGSVYSFERDPFSRFRLGWWTPRGVHFAFDDRHPVGASHHQKIVVIDDSLAFCGGIDLTSHRWDTSAHRLEEPARRTPLGGAYDPYHEVQAMVDGEAAASLGQLARDRWRALGAKDLPKKHAASASLWPADVAPDLIDVDVAIARTMPSSGDAPAVREVEALFIDSIAAARRTIYIESQYFTNRAIGEAIERRLAERDGPEVIVVAPKICHGWLEQNTIGPLREGLFRRLLAADTHKRLRLVYPAASRAKDVATFVHSKVMIVDDTFARIGSANCSNRSMGMDTECDVAVEATTKSSRAGIRGIRDRLVAEHLGLDPAEVDAALADTPLAPFIDSRTDYDRTLARIDVAPEVEETATTELIRAAVDPEEPVGVGPAVDRVVPAVDALSVGSPLRIWILPAAVLTAALFVAWATSASFRAADLHALQRTLNWLPQSPAAAVIAVCVFVLASLVLVPLELLALASGLLFGPVRGGALAVAASLAASTTGYLAGRIIGPSNLSSWMSRRSYRSGQQLVGRGWIAVAVMRLAAFGSAGSIQLTCGAERVPFGAYLAGTAVALSPVVVALGLVGALLRRTALEPSVGNAAVMIGGTLVLFIVASVLRAFFLIRQFSPPAMAQKQRAEFG